MLLLLNASKADAFLGIGDNSEEVYKADTVRMLVVLCQIHVPWRQANQGAKQGQRG